MIQQRKYTIGFCGQYITINCYGSQAEDVIEFLFSDLMVEDNRVEPEVVYDVMAVGKQPMMSLWNGEKKLYFGECLHSLADIMVNNVIYYSIINNDIGHAIHAAAISCGDKGVLFPGNSGSGKSTLVAWLASRGYNYLTDELTVLSSDDHRIIPFLITNIPQQA